DRGTGESGSVPQAMPPPGARGRVPLTQPARAARPAGVGGGQPGANAQLGMPQDISRGWMDPAAGLNSSEQTAWVRLGLPPMIAQMILARSMPNLIQPFPNNG